MGGTQLGDELVDRASSWLATTRAWLEYGAFDPQKIKRGFCIASTDFDVLLMPLRALPRLYAQAFDMRLTSFGTRSGFLPLAKSTLP